MKIELIQHTLANGWDSSSFPSLDSDNTLIIVFAAPAYKHNPQAIKELREHYSNSQMIGCSTSGEILSDEIFDESLSVAIIQFEKTYFTSVRKEITDAKDSFNVGEDIRTELNQDDLKNIFVLSEGLNINGSELVKGLNCIENDQVCITGGLAGDGSDFKNTFTIYNGDIFPSSVVAVAFYSEVLNVGHASRGGWDIFGPSRTITKSNQNVLYELDNQPALSLYKEYLGERANELPASGLLFPLAIKENDEAPKQLVRTILSVDEDAQSLTFAGDVPEGATAQLMRANFDRLISSAHDASELAKQNHQNKKGDILILAISCVGRRLLLGERTEEEVESTLEALPDGAKQIGFYSYGEVSPYSEGNCDLHNQTMTVTVLSEA